MRAVAFSCTARVPAASCIARAPAASCVAGAVPGADSVTATSVVLPLSTLSTLSRGELPVRPMGG
ncbi:hypothetical protein GCM10010372_42770 [Streptomyces tauricus]|nr:hypothetical protein GCM10010372_42770 [Streptomyces tauricus]